jgi:TatD DNase family protein
MKIFDVHCHLDFPQFDGEREFVIEKCKEQLLGVITSGTGYSNNIKTLKLVESHPNFLFACLGLHPTKKEDFSKKEDIKEQIIKNSDKIVAIGEIGLDYFHSKGFEERERQKQIFMEMLYLAEKLQKAVVIHSRNAEKDAIDLISGYKIPSVILHCFNGDLLLLNRAIEKKFYISISTQLLYSKRVQEIATNTPLDFILLETDSPFLNQGEKNYPWNVLKSLEELSKIKKIEREKLAEKLNANVFKAFGIRVMQNNQLSEVK